tara:strand:- start:294 stop:458 length:165 start_codon:yes stop_codon:yes gene_type:complete
MDIKQTIIDKLTNIYEKILNKKVKHVCRACHHIFDEEEMSPDDSSLCKECAKRE